MASEIPEIIRKGDKPHKILVRDIGRRDTDETLLKGWEKSDFSKNGLIVRDSVVEVMKQRGVRPVDWIRKRELETGLYPDNEDPDFAALLFRKTEFANLQSVLSDESVCTASSSMFDTTPIQRLVARFLHPSMPYRGILLNHGVGVGKTCSAITVAETHLEILPQHKVYILAPQAIADGFKRTIFDMNKIKPASKEHITLTGERWTSSQCTGMSYLRMTGMGGETNMDLIQREINRKVNRRYQIMGYLAFANWVQKHLEKANLPGIREEKRKDMEKQILQNLFNDHLIIIDEAHNLRDALPSDEEDEDAVTPTDLDDAASGKKLTPILKQIIQTAEGLRLMFMTATPMYNTAPEIVFLLNLLLLNDKKDESVLMNEKKIFDTNEQLTADGKIQLTKAIKRYVSYMRGENPNTFPLRLTPKTTTAKQLSESYPTISIARKEKMVELTDHMKEIMTRLPFHVSNVDTSSTVGSALIDKISKYVSNISDEPIKFILDDTLQMGNITYDANLYGSSGWKACMQVHKTEINKTKVKQFSWSNKKYSLESVFGKEGLRDHAPKMSAILESVQKAEGISFIYSRYVNAGALPIAIALELAGWCRVLADGTEAPLLKRDTRQKAKHHYILFTSDEELSPNRPGLLSYATTFANSEEANGSKVKAIIGSKIASEGVDLKCIRELHILDGWYHLNRIEQIMGRGVRFCSHIALPPEKRNCLIYLHVMNIPEYETSDLYAYRLAVRKAIPIGNVSRLLKIHAWDCMLNRDAILMSDLPTRKVIDAQHNVYPEYDLHDKPYTSFCDFSSECEYICASHDFPTLTVRNESTFTEADFRRKFAEKHTLLANIFQEEVALPLEFVKETVYGDIPWSIGAIGLREALGNIKIKRSDGLYGTLVLQNGYIVFQPDKVTDTYIPLALRYGRAYGRLPKTITPRFGSVLQTSVPLRVEEVEEEKVGEDHVDPKTQAYTSIQMWSDVVHQFLTMDVGYIAPIGDIPEETFRGLRWVLHHFRDLKETESLAYKWWMDYMWSYEEKIAVFSNMVQKGYDALSVKEQQYADLYKNELFFGELSGFYVYNTHTNNVEEWCYVEGYDSPQLCATMNLMDEFAKQMDEPVDRETETGAVFGLLTTKENNIIFKSVDRAKGRLDGAECGNTSNLKNHESRILLCHQAIENHVPEDATIRNVLLKIVEHDDKKRRTEIQEAIMKRYSAKGSDTTVDVECISDMSLKQSCPYMEFLLRWMDMMRLNKKRWFLSLVETARSSIPKKKKKGGLKK